MQQAVLGIPGPVWMPMTHGWGVLGSHRDEEARRMRNGLEELAAAESGQFGESYWSVLWAQLQQGTCDGCVAALKKFVHYNKIHGWLGPRMAGSYILPERVPTSDQSRSFCRGSGWLKKVAWWHPFSRGRLGVRKVAGEVAQTKGRHLDKMVPVGDHMRNHGGADEFLMARDGMPRTGSAVTMQPPQAGEGVGSPQEWAGTVRVQR